MFRRLGVFIVAPIVLVTALAAGISAFLNYGKFARTLAEVESARFALVAKGVKAGIEANLNLGLSLPGLAVAPQIIERERALVADTLAVVVYGADGAVLFASGQPVGFDQVPAEWRQTSDWSAATSGWRAVGMPLLNPFGAVAGGVAVLYPGDARDAALADMARSLTAASGLAAAATALLSLVILGLLLRRLRGAVADLARELEGGEVRDEAAQAVKAAAARAHGTIAQAAANAPGAGA